MTSKTIDYKGHQIEVLRYAGHSAVNGRELRPMWNAKVDGVPVNSYSLYQRKSAVEAAKRYIELIPKK